MAITLTERAAAHVTNTLAKRGNGIGLRLGVKTVGCSGLAYKVDFADTVEASDLRFESHGVTLLVDPKSLAGARRHGGRLRKGGTQRGVPVQQSEREGELRLRREFQRLTGFTFAIGAAKGRPFFLLLRPERRRHREAHTSKAHRRGRAGPGVYTLHDATTSSGLRTPLPPRFSTCVYTIVVETSLWPSSS